MNELYNLFNPQYVNAEFVNQINVQRYEQKQNEEITKAINAVHDFCEAAKNIDPQHQQMAFYMCLAEITKEFNR